MAISTLLGDLACLTLDQRSTMMNINTPPVPEERTREATFEPALSKQRYNYCHQLLKQHTSITRLTDLGAGECQLARYVKTNPNLSVCNFVEIRAGELEQALYNAAPGAWDSIFGRHISKEPLDMLLWRGNILEPDQRVASQTDAITMIEVIEHLHQNELEKVPDIVFGVYQPQMCIITTPNQEFNVMFKDPTGQPIQRRHYDHKFEWTRAQFVEWCTSVVARYPHYNVTYDGVGHLPGSEGLGPCTQIAIFTRDPRFVVTPIVGLPQIWEPFLSFRYSGNCEPEQPNCEVNYDWSKT